MGLTVSMRIMESRLKKLWESRGSIHIFDMPQGYLVHFTNEDDYNHVLYEGPRMIASHYFFIRSHTYIFLIHLKFGKQTHHDIIK